MAREVSARDLEELGDERFEQLIASIVFASHPDAERPAAPDGGADVLVPATASRGALVWQVKHYPTNIAWKKCEDSLDDAVATYGPAEVIFVFPRNLSAPLRSTFQTRLVERKPDVRVTHWGLQGIQDELARHPDICTRYFGEDRADVMPGVIRAMQQGGKPLEDTRDLVDRAFALDEFADVTDPSFEYDISVGKASMKDRTWKEPPFMVVHDIRGERRVSADAWLRPEASASARFGFTNDDAGDAARDAVREGLAAGEDVELTTGLWMMVDNAPVVVAEAMKAMEAEGIEHHAVTISAGMSFEFTLELDEGPDAAARTFLVRAIPPRKGLHVLALGCVADGLALFVDIEPDEPPKLHVHLNLAPRPVADPATNAAAARFMLAFHSATTIACSAPVLFRKRTVLTDAGAPQSGPTSVERWGLRAAMYDALVALERRFGPIEVPERVTAQHFMEVLTAAQVLQTGAGTWSFEELVIELPNDHVDDFLQRADGGHSGRYPLHLNVFDQQLQVGLAEFKTPPIKFIATERGAAPGTTRLRVRTDSTAVPFRLIEPETDVQPVSSLRLWTPPPGHGRSAPS